MKKIIALFLLLLIFIGKTVSAQQVQELKKSNYEDAAKRTTIVVLMTEDPKKTLKLKKTPEDYEAYKADIESYNTTLQAAVEKWWKFTEKYEFHSYVDAVKMSKGKLAKNYVILLYQLQRSTPAPASGEIASTLPYKKLSTPDAWGCFELRTPENIMPTKPALATAKMEYQGPRDGDIVFALQLMQFDLQNKIEDLNDGQIMKNVMTNGKNLQGKTLMIDKGEFKEDEIGEDKIKKVYNFEYIAEDIDTINARAMSGNTDFAYIKIVPIENNKLRHYVLSCEDGTVCAFWDIAYNPKTFKKDRITLDAMKAYGRFAK